MSFCEVGADRAGVRRLTPDQTATDLIVRADNELIGRRS